MGGLIAVGKGSEVSPRLIVAEYRGGRPGSPWTALVGKGVTFDTGGISLKKWEGMEKMKYDMAGGAGMLDAVRAAAALGIRRNIVAIVPAVENMPSGAAYRPGDVLRMMSGKTVEVLSTDAEGRLILADAIRFEKKRYRPAVILDAATLTGACVVALGSVTMAMMGNDAKVLGQMREASAASGERAWELPLHEEYFEQIKSDIGDLKNIGGPEAGAITAGYFLKEFAGETPWVHLDIAGVAWREKEKMGYAPGPTSRRIPAQGGDGGVSAGSRGGEDARDAAAFAARRSAYRLPALHDPDSGGGARLSPLPATGSPRGGAATHASLRSRVAGSRRPVGTARQMGQGGGPDSPGPCRSSPRVPAMDRLPRDGGGQSFASGPGGGDKGGGRRDPPGNGDEPGRRHPRSLPPLGRGHRGVYLPGRALGTEDGLPEGGVPRRGGASSRGDGDVRGGGGREESCEGRSAERDRGPGNGAGPHPLPQEEVSHCRVRGQAGEERVRTQRARAVTSYTVSMSNPGGRRA